MRYTFRVTHEKVGFDVNTEELEHQLNDFGTQGYALAATIPTESDEGELAAIFVFQKAEGD